MKQTSVLSSCWLFFVTVVSFALPRIGDCVCDFVNERFSISGDFFSGIRTCCLLTKWPKIRCTSTKTHIWFVVFGDCNFINGGGCLRIGAYTRLENENTGRKVFPF